MDLTIMPGKLQGKVGAIPSKSQAHRMLICAAFADAPTFLGCPETNRDIDATAQCLIALGAQITRSLQGFAVTPIQKVPKSAILSCQDSGSTLRFLLPVAGALGCDTTFLLNGRLPQRPLSPLWEEMERMGCHLSRPTENTVRCQGRLQAGTYTINGGVSSQFITGLLLALALVPGESRLTVLGQLESAPYVTMTQRVMALFGKNTEGLAVSGGCFHSPGKQSVEGDWSNAAFFLAAKALGSDIQVENLNLDSAQGDRACFTLLPELVKEQRTICAADIPDLVPILSVVAAAAHGAVFTNIHRLRLKESDRVESVIQMLKDLGGKAEAMGDTLRVYGTGLTGGTVDSRNDHRIAMSAAVASTVCSKSVTILGAECTEKSYPSFFGEFKRLGGSYEQHLR